MTKTHACPLPPISALHPRFRPGDFLDCYTVRSDMAARPAAEIIASFPDWAKLLVKLRGLLTAPFGLTNEAPKDARDLLAIFPVIDQTDHEVLAGFDDKHLNFVISVMSQDGQVYLSTWVHPHNLGGRAYLALIMPFHILIVRNALKRVAKHGAGLSNSAAVGTR